MMRVSPPAAARKEPTIALINIVFLMLIFFMIAGTLAPPLDKNVQLVRTEGLEGRAPPDALVAHADGRLAFRGAPVAGAAAYAAGLGPDELKAVRIVPDRALPARELVRLGRELRAAGTQRVILVTERALQ